MNKNIQEKIIDIQNKVDFSGSVSVEDKVKVLAEENFGYANRSDQIKNNSATRFGIASGCKLFTAIAICQLVEKREISFNSKLTDHLDVELKHVDEKVTVHHLLTHTSGIPDYFDEDVMDDFEELWVTNPMYHIKKLEDFLPLFQDEPMRAKVGESFHYNNAGYILLGLIVERVSGLEFSDYIQAHIFNQANMKHSGYFAFDALPANTALGYIDKVDGSWKTNIYSLPVKGGSDGGAYVTTNDMAKLWTALMNFQLLNETYTNKLLSTHIQVNDSGYYGYGIWIKKTTNNNILKYHVMGYDPGVSFHSAYYPDLSIKVVVCSNKSDGAFDIMSGIEEELVKIKNLK
ncbi:putative penicillin-binding protein PbpX [Paraliobacillus ryukyuensis]|uniref:CubicO group peptidase (Beta-lactamase class C family) n=1 Tax=Paraliobacillus ryukyuensis TaxID=200904 RepID=A0A366E441_9BACI|nr:serine hydrolase [Paraliobacillus ryukyuensis]RBO97141.1 CubicO group peptidase (beta-lactamase class C family) [Paraliobacillus ryukyuensis]